MWIKEKNVLGGFWADDYRDRWIPRKSTKDLAWAVIDLFNLKFGGIWTGCFDLSSDMYCRGALAAAALVASVYELEELTTEKREKIDNPSRLILGYMLSSLGRSILHGDSSSIGNTPITKWKVKLNDFVAMQAIYLRLYMTSVGRLYSHQLDKHVPMKFTPSFNVYTKRSKKDEYHDIEPVFSSLRNLMFTESLNLIDFGPYRPMVALNNVKNDIIKHKRRRVLIDVGANGFFASPKYLLDSYSIYLPFTHAIMIEPEPHFSATVPDEYLKNYNITFLQIYAEVGTGNSNDMLKLLPSLVTKDDFVVLKFDVDPNKHAQGYTMEWGFLFSLMGTREIAELIDELYIELHFYMPMLFWDHYHSNWEALDAIRYLRKHGIYVHAWP
eukprot:gene18617-24348_t